MLYDMCLTCEEASIAGSSVCQTEILCNFGFSPGRGKQEEKDDDRTCQQVVWCLIFLRSNRCQTVTSPTYFGLQGRWPIWCHFWKARINRLIINCHDVHFPIASHLDVGTIAEIWKMMAKRNLMTLAREMLRSDPQHLKISAPHHESRDICGRHVFLYLPKFEAPKQMIGCRWCGISSKEWSWWCAREAAISAKNGGGNFYDLDVGESLVHWHIWMIFHILYYLIMFEKTTLANFVYPWGKASLHPAVEGSSLGSWRTAAARSG